MIDLTNYNFKFIDSKEYNYNYNTTEKHNDEIFITKYKDKIFVFDNNL